MKIQKALYYVKSVRIQSYAGLYFISPYSVRMWENADKNNSKYGPFLRNVKHIRLNSSQEFTFFF